MLWIDYGLRALVIALGAWLGARWLSAPVRRLATASQQVGAELARGHAPPRLDERGGTAEVRQAAHLFNSMGQRLREQFDLRSLHVAALSHDLRTPITRLRLRLDSAPPELARPALADLHAMNELIDSTLQLLHEERDAAPAGIVDLQALAQALVDDRAAAGEPVTLASCHDGAHEAAPLRVRAHPVALRRVIDNLVGNALRHGGVARVAVQPAASGRLRLTVDDDGPGIPEDQLGRVFEPWVRLPLAGGEATQVRPGHGLGLAIARELAQRDGATLTLANRPGGGLQARLELPAV